MGNTNRKKAIVCLIASVGCAFVAFFALFSGGINHLVAAGIIILGILGFVWLYNKGFDLLVAVGDVLSEEEVRAAVQKINERVQEQP